jgi:hypothetical protein
MPSNPLTLVSSSPSEHDPIPADVRAVIDLFATYLAKVAFPEVDAALLRKQADEVRAEAKAIAQAREALAAAEAKAAARLATLTETTTRAIAYARIYGQAHPDRKAILDAVTALDGPTETPVTSIKRRGRPPKQREGSAELFVQPEPQ